MKKIITALLAAAVRFSVMTLAEGFPAPAEEKDPLRHPSGKPESRETIHSICRSYGSASAREGTGSELRRNPRAE